MSSESPYKIGLGPKILGRARLILGSLFALLVFFTIAGIHQGAVSGDFDKVFLKPFRDFAADFEKAAQPLPTPTFSPLPTFIPSTPTPTKKPVPIQYTQPVVPNCLRLNIREGEFVSNKCYSQQDYDDLQYYLGKYNSAVGSVSFYETEIRIVCGNTEFFGNKCEQAKKEQAENNANIPNYKNIIQGIIAKGK